MSDFDLDIVDDLQTWVETWDSKYNSLAYIQVANQ